MLYKMQELSVDGTNVQNVTPVYPPEINKLITEDLLLGQTEGLLPGESMSSTFSPISTDGKYYAPNVTQLKQGEKMNEGKKFDNGKPPMELLSSIALVEMAKVMGKGKEKYGAQNWRSGLAWSRVVGAAFRHISAFNDGEDKDPETGLSHIAHAACCCMFLLEYIARHPNLDDRYRLPNKDLTNEESKSTIEVMVTNGCVTELYR